MGEPGLPARVTVHPQALSGARMVSIGEGRWVPRRFSGTYDDPAKPFRVSVEILVTGDGVAIPYQLGYVARLDPAIDDIDNDGRLVDLEGLGAASWQQITGDDLRVPLNAIVNAVLEEVTRRGEIAPPGTPGQPGQRFHDAGRFLVGDNDRAVLRPITSSVGRSLRGRRRVLTPEHLREVAAVVTEARRAGLATRRAVADRWVVPENTARNWISAARLEGYLDDDKKEPL